MTGLEVLSINRKAGTYRISFLPLTGGAGRKAAYIKKGDCKRVDLSAAFSNENISV